MPEHLRGHARGEEAAQHPVLARGTVDVEAAPHRPAEAAGGRGLDRADEEERGAGHGVRAEVDGGGDGEPEEGDGEGQELAARARGMTNGALQPRQSGGGAEEAGDACMCVCRLVG